MLIKPPGEGVRKYRIKKGAFVVKFDKVTNKDRGLRIKASFGPEGEEGVITPEKLDKLVLKTLGAPPDHKGLGQGQTMPLHMGKDKDGKPLELILERLR
jgi:hypothetical protein